MNNKLKKALEEIRNYINGSEFRRFATKYLFKEYGENYTSKILEDRISIYLRFFSDEADYNIPYLGYNSSMISFFHALKLNYRQKGLVLAYTLNKNAKLIENSSYKDLKSFALAHYEDCFNEKCTIDDLVRLFQFAPKIIRRYIDEKGDFKPLMVLDGDKDLLKKTPFLLTDEQIENILYFNKRKYDELISQQLQNPTIVASKHSKVKEENPVDYKSLNPLYKNLKLYLDEKGNVLDTISDEECDDLLGLVENLNWSKKRIKEIHIQVNKLKKLHEEEREQEYLKKLEELKDEIFTEEESKTYELFVSLVQEKYFSSLFEKSVIDIIRNIDETLKEILKSKIKFDSLMEDYKYKGILINVNEEIKKYENLKEEDIELIKLYFAELNEISNECSLSEITFIRGRKKKEN